MIKLLLIAQDETALSGPASALKTHDDVTLSWAASGGRALDMIPETDVDLVIADEQLGDMTGIEFANRMVVVAPLKNCALVSSLAHDAFHEATEGLGLLGHLPVNAGKKEIDRLLRNLKKISSLL